MKLTVQPLDLKMEHPFGISRWTKTETHNVLVRISHQGIEGVGEGAPNARYGESQEQAVAFLNALDLERFDGPENVHAVMEYVSNLDDGNWSAKAALDMALHDWFGKSAGQPLYRLWGGESNVGPATSFTIGLAEPEAMAERAAGAGAYSVLKIKVGTERDREMIEAIRAVTEVPLRVDANEGWTTREEALERIEWLALQGVELVEQPMPAGRFDDMCWLHERSPLPLVADEDCGRRDSIEHLQGAFHAVNIKLDKCGGLAEARAMETAARSLGLGIMVGCMISSSVSTTAAAHFALNADYVDLDGHLLLADDPFSGVLIEDGRIVVPERPGIGVVPRR